MDRGSRWAAVRAPCVALTLAVLSPAACAIDVQGTAGRVELSTEDAAAPPASAPASVEPPEAGVEQPLEPDDAGIVDGGAPALDAGAASFVVIAPPGGTYTIFPPGTRNPCSKGGGAGTLFRVENTTAQSARLFWYDGSCDERDYGRVSAGLARGQGTYVGHRWRVRRGSDNALLGDFVIDSAPATGVFRVILR